MQWIQDEQQKSVAVTLLVTRPVLRSRVCVIKKMWNIWTWDLDHLELAMDFTEIDN